MKTIQLYTSSFYVGFAEEILYRGVIFGLSFAITRSNLWALVISSVMFGLWHLKNYPIYPNWKPITGQVIFSTLIGMGLGVVRILTGDLYLAILLHTLIDVFHALASQKLRDMKIAVPYEFVRDYTDFEEKGLH
jgi:membrane protease YdiL (CAAX protease family)